MSPDQNARQGAILLVDDTTPTTLQKPRPEPAKRHVISRNLQSRAGRLYCYEDLDVEVPSLELYAAR